MTYLRTLRSLGAQGQATTIATVDHNIRAAHPFPDVVRHGVQAKQPGHLQKPQT